MNSFLPEAFFSSSTEYYDALLESLSLAQHEILFESYAFDFDSVGKEFLNQLEAAKKRGLNVRLIVDGLGSWGAISELRAWSRHSGVKLKVYHPLWPTRGLTALFRTLNKRNHRKMILIDGNILYFGSLNISKIHLSWRDYGARINLTPSESELVKTAYNRTWSKWSGIRQVFNPKNLKLTRRRSHRAITSRILFNHSLPSRLRFSRFLHQTIHQAEKFIWITTPYFLPRALLKRALYHAVKRGVEVKLLLPHKSDVWIVKMATRSLYRKLLRKGLRIFEYSKGVLHAKSLVTDKKLLLGSNNWNHRSLMHDLEILVNVTDPKFHEHFLVVFDQDLHFSREIELKELEMDPRWQRILGKFFYWFRYWL